MSQLEIQEVRQLISQIFGTHGACWKAAREFATRDSESDLSGFSNQAFSVDINARQNSKKPEGLARSEKRGDGWSKRWQAVRGAVMDKQPKATTEQAARCVRLIAFINVALGNSSLSVAAKTGDLTSASQITGSDTTIDAPTIRLLRRGTKEYWAVRSTEYIGRYSKTPPHAFVFVEREVRAIGYPSEGLSPNSVASYRTSDNHTITIVEIHQEVGMSRLQARFRKTQDEWFVENHGKTDLWLKPKKGKPKSTPVLIPSPGSSKPQAIAVDDGDLLVIGHVAEFQIQIVAGGSLK